MIFSAERLIELCPQPETGTLETIAMVLNDRGPDFGLTRHLRRCHFIAQVAHESGGFRRFIENLNYSALRIGQVWPRLASRAHELAHRPEALANAAYCDRMGNGDEASGDGWRYRGRGLIMITGKNNYRDMGKLLGRDLLANPGIAADADIGAMTALAFWKSHGCNEVADTDSVAAVTRIINGGDNGLQEREALTHKALQIFILTDDTSDLVA